MQVNFGVQGGQKQRFHLSCRKPPIWECSVTAQCLISELNWVNDHLSNTKHKSRINMDFFPLFPSEVSHVPDNGSAPSEAVIL